MSRPSRYICRVCHASLRLAPLQNRPCRSTEPEPSLAGIFQDSVVCTPCNIPTRVVYLSLTQCANCRSTSRFIMGLFKSLKGEHPEHIGRDDLSDQRYQAPPGPPPSNFAETQKGTSDNNRQAPPGPLPTEIPSDNPPPYHDWTSIPDTSLLPPPPSLGHESSKYNATWDDAARAHAFCDQFPPYRPAQPSPAVQQAVRNGDIVIERPREYAGELKPVAASDRGVWSAKSKKGCGDCVLLSALVSIDGSLTITVPSALFSCELTISTNTLL
jgi:hypothetical protein